MRPFAVDTSLADAVMFLDEDRQVLQLDLLERFGVERRIILESSSTTRAELVTIFPELIDLIGLVGRSLMTSVSQLCSYFSFGGASAFFLGSRIDDIAGRRLGRIGGVLVGDGDLVFEFLDPLLELLVLPLQFLDPPRRRITPRTTSLLILHHHMPTIGNSQLATTAFSKFSVNGYTKVNKSTVYAADVDGDGDVDVISASTVQYDGTIVWYENTNGKGVFGNQRLIATKPFAGIHVDASVAVTDLDRDGDVDVLWAFGAEFAWYENTDRKGTFGNQHVIATAGGSRSVYAADIDGDRDVDVLAASGGGLVWYENTDGKGTFGSQRVIADARGVTSIYPSDVDRDGDIDVLVASFDNDNFDQFDDDKITWYENTNGRGTFGSQRVIRRT
jgi:hypothetical protein